MSLMPALGRRREEDPEFRANMGFIVIPGQISYIRRLCSSLFISL